MDDIDRLAELFARVKRLEDAAAMPILPYSSLDDAAVPEKDATGAVKSVWGRQWDGTHGIADLSGPKPPKPTPPVVVSKPGGADITWDGEFDGGEVAPMDFARVEVHLSTNPDAYESLGRDTIIATIDSAMGGTVSVRLPSSPPHYAWLMTRTRAGVSSDCAPDGEGVDAWGLDIPDASQITAIQDALNGKNRIVHSPDDPDPEMDGLVDGDTWFKHSVAGVVGQWRWDGAGWVAQEITSEVIANLEVGKLLTGTISAGQRIIAGDENGARVELDEHGLRKYADDGVSLDVVLDENGAVFSGTVVGSAVVGGDIYTNLTGPRVHMHDGMDPAAIERILATLGMGPMVPGITAAGTDISLHSGLPGVEPGSISTLNASEASINSRWALLALTGPATPGHESAKLILSELTIPLDDEEQRIPYTVLTTGIAQIYAVDLFSIESDVEISLVAPAVYLPWRQTSSHGANIVVIVVADTAARDARLAAITTRYAPGPIPRPVVVWREDAPAGQQLEAWNGTTWDTIGGQPAASTDAAGIVELATTTETTTGTDATRAVTPAGLAARTATTTRTGLVELATSAETTAGTDATRAVTPAGLKARLDATPTWTMPSFTNGWGQFNATTYPVAYTKINGVVYLRGLISGGTVNASAFTLPAGYRPSTDSVFQSFAGTSGTLGRLNILANGNVVPVTAGMDGWTSLFVASFPAAV